MTPSADTRCFGVWELLGNVVGSLWIAGGTLFFLIRFCSVFYRANQSAVDSVVEKLMQSH